MQLFVEHQERWRRIIPCATAIRKQSYEHRHIASAPAPCQADLVLGTYDQSRSWVSASREGTRFKSELWPTVCVHTQGTQNQVLVREHVRRGGWRTAAFYEWNGKVVGPAKFWGRQAEYVWGRKNLYIFLHSCTRGDLTYSAFPVRREHLLQLQRLTKGGARQKIMRTGGISGGVSVGGSIILQGGIRACWKGFLRVTWAVWKSADTQDTSNTWKRNTSKFVPRKHNMCLHSVFGPHWFPQRDVWTPHAPNSVSASAGATLHGMKFGARWSCPTTHRLSWWEDSRRNWNNRDQTYHTHASHFRPRARRKLECAWQRPSPVPQRGMLSWVVTDNTTWVWPLPVWLRTSSRAIKGEPRRLVCRPRLEKAFHTESPNEQISRRTTESSHEHFISLSCG